MGVMVVEEEEQECRGLLAAEVFLVKRLARYLQLYQSIVVVSIDAIQEPILHIL